MILKKVQMFVGLKISILPLVLFKQHPSYYGKLETQNRNIEIVKLNKEDGHILTDDNV